MHTKSTTPHRPQHQVGHARREYDAAPGQATADLADNPIARGILLALVIALSVVLPIVALRIIYGLAGCIGVVIAVAAALTYAAAWMGDRA